MEMRTINGYRNIINLHNRVGANIIRPRNLYRSTGTHPANLNLLKSIFSKESPMLFLTEANEKYIDEFYKEEKEILK